MLILSGDDGIKRSAPNWMAWLLHALGAPDPLEGERLTFGCSTKVLQNLDGAFRSSEESRTLTVHLVKPDTHDHGTETVRPAAGEVFPMLSVDPLPAQWKGEIFSATRIRTYRECPAQYYLKYVLGMPSGGVMTARSGDDELRDQEYPAELRGRVFHSVMQNIDRILTSGGVLEREIRKFLLLEAPADQSRSDSFVAEIAAAVAAVTDSSFWSQVRSGSDTRTEFTISSVIGEDYLSGTMDRVYRDAGDVWHVLDFKTDQVAESSLGKKAGMYWPQLEFYALLVHRFFNAPSVVAEVLFSQLPGKPLQRTYTAAPLKNVEEEVALTIGKIKAGDFRPANPPCEICPFTTGCPWQKP
jgi:ATP-dependent exoDNAse (exonuclease V) beta subunit